MFKTMFIAILVSSAFVSCNLREKEVFDDLMDGVKSTTDKIIDDENGKKDPQGNLVQKPKVDVVKKNSKSETLKKSK